MPLQYVRQLARARRRTREKGLSADLSINDWNDTLLDWGWMCAFCDQSFETIDHYIPLVSGGTTSKGNCIPSCFRCNNKKGALLPENIVV
jgi:hypothetical protein